MQAIKKYEEIRKQVVFNYVRKMGKIMKKPIPQDVLKIVTTYVAVLLVNLLDTIGESLDYNVIYDKFNGKNYYFRTSYTILKYDGAYHMHWRIQPTQNSWENIRNIKGVVLLAAYHGEQKPHEREKPITFSDGNKNQPIDEYVPNNYIQNGFSIAIGIKVNYVQKRNDI